MVEVVTGARAVQQRLAQIRRWARREIRCLDKPPYLEGDGGESGASQLLGRGLICCTIYDRSSLDHPGALTVVERLIRAGQHARVLPHLAVKLYLADDRLAFLPLPPRALRLRDGDRGAPVRTAGRVDQALRRALAARPATAVPGRPASAGEAAFLGRRAAAPRCCSPA